MVDISGSDFGEGALEESLVGVAIMVATCHGSIWDVKFKGQRRSRSLHSRKMFAMVER